MLRVALEAQQFSLQRGREVPAAELASAMCACVVTAGPGVLKRWRCYLEYLNSLSLFFPSSVFQV